MFSPTTGRGSLLAAAALLTALALPSAARGDEPIAEVAGEDAPVAAHAGWIAWSQPDGDRYRLVLRDPRGRVTVPDLPSSSRPWDVALGPDARGDVVAVYRRCTSSGCDVRRLPVAGGREETLTSVSSSQYDEGTPAIWGSTVAFTRRVDGCDVPYVKTLGTSDPSRRLLKSKCLNTPPGHLAVRGSAVVASSLSATGAAEVRRYSTTTGSSVVLVHDDRLARFGQVVLGGDGMTTVRHGTGARHAFVRVAGGETTEIDAHLSLAGGYARGVYVEAQDAEIDTCDSAVQAPCRVVVQSSSPFGGAERALPPRLTIADAPPQAPALDGRLARSIVRGERVVRTEPLAGVAVGAARRTRAGFVATPISAATTAADGTWSLAVGASRAGLTAIAGTAPVASWAGSGTTGLPTT